jgi:ectoine hydroxylase-related dioxygenase (phytanoyl-CoA dioxygenase family)
MLSPAEVEFFKDQGYLKVERLLEAPRIAELRALADAELDKARKSAGQSKLDILEGKNYADTPAVFRLSRVMARHEAFKSVALDPLVADDVRALVGNDARVCINRHNMMIVKAAHVGRQVDWHQDGFNWGNDGIVSMMVFLDDATVANGCLEIIPGLHKRGLLPSAQNNAGNGLDLNRPEIAAWTRQALPVPANAGDAIFFHSCTPHFSRANSSEFSRRNLVFAYVSGSDMRTSNVPIESLELASTVAAS